MAKILYYWDKQTDEFDHSEFFMTDDELPNPLPENATLVAPTDGLYEPITWDGTTWIGTDKETWAANCPLPNPLPTEQDKKNASILLEIAQNKKEQDKFNAQIMLTLAQKGGNN